MFSSFVLMMTKLRSSPQYTPDPDILLHISYNQGKNQNCRLPSSKADHENLRYKLRSLQTIPRQPVIAHTNSPSLSGQIQTFQLMLNGIFLMWLHNKCLSLWVRLWPHRLRVCNYPKMYSCQQHTIFNTSLAFQVKLTLHSQILPSRQLYPNWDFRYFISREGRSLRLWF